MVRTVQAGFPQAQCSERGRDVKQAAPPAYHAGLEEHKRRTLANRAGAVSIIVDGAVQLVTLQSHERTRGCVAVRTYMTIPERRSTAAARPVPA